MRVGILGPLEVMADGRDVPVQGARLRTLLVTLALDAGSRVTAKALGDALWTGEGPADRTNALQTLVTRLRRVLPEGRLLSVPGGYRLDLPSDAVDARRFERLAGEGSRALKDGAPQVAVRLLREGLGLWRGELGAETPDAARRRLEELRLTAEEDRAEAALAVGAPEGLVAVLEELVAVHPFRERLRGLLIEALHSDGRSAEALTVYEEFRGFLAAELGADPGPSVQAAHLAVLRGEAARPKARGNIHATMTSLVGRDDDLDRLRARLADHRLVTLSGPGGVGKTRLAVAVAAEAPDRAWLVDLAPVTGRDAAAGAIAAALGAGPAGPQEPPGDPVGCLAEALTGDPALIVLDNCEHVVEETARIAAELLGRCPGLRVIVTSREPLGVPGEILHPVPPLAPEHAARLFAERAAAVSSGFAVTGGNAAVVAEICRRLDGLPLAIELAAARLRSVPLTDLAIGLNGRVEHSARGGGVATRHQTLRAVVAWSWDLLDEDERRAARRLAAFPGIVTVDSAEAVAAADLDLLAALTDKSLLQFDGEHYRMLETIRSYALEELMRSGELTQVRAAHASFFAGLAERAQPYLRGPDQLPWLVRLTAERDNLNGALRFAHEAGDASTALRMCAALGLFWLIRRDHDALASRPAAALELPGEAAPEARAVTVALHLLTAGIWSGRWPDADLADRTRRIELDERDPGTAFVEPVLAFGAGDHAAASAAIDRRLAHPDPWIRAMARLVRAVLHGNAGDVTAMRADLERAIDGFRAVGERAGLAWSLTALADLRTIRGEFDGAIAGLAEAMRLLRELDPADQAVMQRVWLAEARARRADPGDAEQAGADLRELLRTGMPDADHRTVATLTLGDLARRSGDLPEAARLLRQADDELGPDGDPQYRATLHCMESDLAMDRSDLATAHRRLALAFDVTVSIPDTAMAAITAARLARLRSMRDDTSTAVELLGAAHTLIGTLGALDSDLVRLGPALRDRLGEDAYEAAYARGRDLDPGRALSLVGSLLSPSDPTRH